MSGWPAKAFRCGRLWTDRIERSLLTLLVTGMVFLAALQIVLRNFWKTGLPWAEPLLGMALLWLTMLGALAATGLGRHLAIDLVAALVPHRARAWIARVTSLFAVVVAIRYGIDPVHLAIIFLANLAIGYSTPPVGMNLFIAAMRLNKPLMKLAGASLALMGLMLGVLLLITYWPALSLTLVR